MTPTISPLTHLLGAIKWGKFYSYSRSLQAELLKSCLFREAEVREHLAPEIIAHSGFWLTPHMFLPLLLSGSETIVSGALGGKTHTILNKVFLKRMTCLFICDVTDFFFHQHEKISVIVLKFTMSTTTRTHVIVGHDTWVTTASSWGAFYLVLPLGITVRQSYLIDHLQLIKNPQGTTLTWTGNLNSTVWFPSKCFSRSVDSIIFSHFPSEPLAAEVYIYWT